jgi:uridine kinase
MTDRAATAAAAASYPPSVLTTVYPPSALAAVAAASLALGAAAAAAAAVLLLSRKPPPPPPQPPSPASSATPAGGGASVAARRALGARVDSAYPLGAAVVAPRRLELGAGGGGGGGGGGGNGGALSLPASSRSGSDDGCGGDEDDGGRALRTVIVGVAGASGSGKTSIATLIQAALGGSARTAGIRVRSVSCDSYYLGLPPGVDASLYNWDHPAALDLDRLAADLRQLREGGDVSVPTYCFSTHKRLAETTPLRGCETDVVIVDGIFVLYSEALRATFDVTIFTSEDLDVCLSRRLRRDVVERGRTVDSVLDQWARFVKPGFVQFVQPSLSLADLIIPRARDNTTAIKMLARDIERRVHGYVGAALIGSPVARMAGGETPSM